MAKKMGDHVPNINIKYYKNKIWHDLQTGDLFKEKKVALFALPGAFTPTCSSMHLPGFLAYKTHLNDYGIDSIICLSVNDTFVMNAWAEAQNVYDHIFMLPDGNGDFTKEMGMLVNKSNLGFGFRSWRYSMIVNNGIIETIFEEDRNDPGDPFKVSDAKTMIQYLKDKTQNTI